MTRATHILSKLLQSLCALTPLFRRVQAVREHVLLLNERLVDRVFDSEHLLLALESLSRGLGLHDPLKLWLKSCGQVLGQDCWLVQLLDVLAKRAKTRTSMAALTRDLPWKLSAQTGHGRGLLLEFWVHYVDLLPIRDESLARNLSPSISVMRSIELKWKSFVQCLLVVMCTRMFICIDG